MKTWKVILQFLLGIALVGAVGALVWSLLPRPKTPPGWQIIRPPTDVMALTLYQQAIWSGGRDGVVRIDPVSGSLLETVQAHGKGFRFVTSLLATHDGAIWIGHAGGASRFDGNTWSLLNTEGGLPSNHVLALAEGGAGELWVGTEAGLACCQAGVCVTYKKQDGLASDIVSTLYLDSHGILWAGNGYSSGGGLSAWDGETWRIYSTSDRLVHPVVNAILEDRQGNLWFGTGFASRGAASRFDGTNWTSITRADGLAGDKVRSLFQDASGALWFGSEYDGVARYDGHTWLTLNINHGLSGLEVKAMLQTPDGDLWLGTENGITRISAQALLQETIVAGQAGIWQLIVRERTQHGRCFIEYLGSGISTFFNGEPIQQETPLQLVEQIQIGSNLFEIASPINPSPSTEETICPRCRRLIKSGV
ncbi:MAG: two-component regulator propeller domain-containing protein [Kiritimatiellota bacterium]|nr:two-component regulator propeller domain-containing protein [Kiritimatiellota bacterium]